MMSGLHGGHGTDCVGAPDPFDPARSHSASHRGIESNPVSPWAVLLYRRDGQLWQTVPKSGPNYAGADNPLVL
jgi:hypothetical protein